MAKRTRAGQRADERPRRKGFDHAARAQIEDGKWASYAEDAGRAQDKRDREAAARIAAGNPTPAEEADQVIQKLKVEFGKEQKRLSGKGYLIHALDVLVSSAFDPEKHDLSVNDEYDRYFRNGAPRFSQLKADFMQDVREHGGPIKESEEFFRRMKKEVVSAYEAAFQQRFRE